nr:MAG TPA: Protein of unknown function (DUF2634) [Caudoviricetes sp.]
MFPTDINLEKIIKNEESEQAKELSHIGRSFLFDFSTGQHTIIDGAVIECDELTAIRQWLELMCRTALEKYHVYQGEAFGTSAEKFIGHRTLPQGFVASELEREISESVKLNPAIDRAGNFSVERQPHGMRVAFTAYLKNGELLEVRKDV